MKKVNYIELLDKYKPKKQNIIFKFLFRIALTFATLGKPIKYIYHFNKKDVKGKQVLFLADHSSRNAYLYALKGYKWQTFQCLVGYQNFFETKFLFKMLTAQGAVPKMLFAPDARSVINTFRLVKQGVSIAIFPEGIQSSVGKAHPTNPATFKFIKSLGLDVILSTSKGEYLNRPRCTDFDHTGKCEIEYRILFTKEELKQLTEKEIEERYNKYFHYNDFKWNKDMHYEYKSKKESNAKCFENLLYHCPKCNKEFEIKAVNNSLLCSCGNEIEIDSHYDMIPLHGSYMPFDRIDMWYDSQRELVKEEVKNENFKIEYECNLYQIDPYLEKERYIDVGLGKVIIDREHFTYKGMQNGKEVELVFDIKLMPSFTFMYGKGNEVYLDNKYYSFYPTTTKNMVIKYMLYIEELHNLLDPIWNEAYKKIND